MYFDQQQQPQIQTKMIINTEDIKFIVQRLQQEPFNENISLVEFDDLNALELLELVNKVLIKMDDQIHNVNVREELQQNTINRIVEFLKVINFPVQENEQFNLGIVQGEKKVIYPILYYILSKWDELQTRAYLARFLVPVFIPEEIGADLEVTEIYSQYKDLQAEFQVSHQQLEIAQKEMMKPQELKKEIIRYEQEKEQLNSKINLFKSKNNNKQEFNKLLEVTNQLRLQQEEEANIQEKIRNQKQQQDWTDQQLMAAQQRLIDIKKSVSGESPEQMLIVLRNEVRRNRDIAQERLALEIGEKKNKLNQYDRMLKEPPVTSQELNTLENQMVLLDKDVRSMTEKLRKINPEDDKLAIYKQQANLVIKKKEKLQQQLKKLEEQQKKLEKDINSKDSELQKQRGPGYGKTNDDFKAYANKLKEKQVKFKKMKEELKNIQSEIAVLSRTEQIVLQRKEQLEQQVQKNEKEKGILGYGQIKEENEMISEQKEQIDLQKTKKLEQITEIVGNIQKELGNKKDQLTKQVNQLKELKTQYNDIHSQIYTHKKNEYDQIMSTINQQNQQLEEAIKQLKESVYKDDTKIEIYEFQKKLYELKLQRLNDENNYMKGNSRLDENNKTYRDLYKNKISKQELEIKQIKLQRDVIKENHEPSLKQMTMFNNLQKLLQVKIQLASGGQVVSNYSKQGNVDRLVL